MWKKLQLKVNRLVVTNAPTSFASNLKEIEATHNVEKAIGGPFDYLLAFVTTVSDVESLVKKMRPNLKPDSVVWLAYLKKSSKKYHSEINRDKGFEALASVGYEPVSQVAIDEDWSALRFRNVENIKVMKRGFAQTEVGKRKVQESRDKGLTCGTTTKKAKTSGEGSDIEPSVKKRSRSAKS